MDGGLTLAIGLQPDCDRVGEGAGFAIFEARLAVDFANW